MTNILAHNRPPGDDHDPLTERLRETNAALHDRAAELLAAEERLPDSLTDESVGKVSDFAAQIKACIKTAEAVHKTEKEPFLTAGRKVDAWLGGLKSPLMDLCQRVEARVTAYLRAKEDAERKRRIEEAKRLQAEAQALAAAGDKGQAREVREEARELREEAKHGKPADMARLHTGLGAVATLQQRWVGEVVDARKLDLEQLRPHLSLEALQKAVNGFVRAGGRELAGAKIFQDTRARIR